MALEEDAKLVSHGVGDQVDELSMAVWVDADREAFGDIASGPFVAVPDDHVRQLRGVDRGKRHEMRGLLLGGPQPDQLGTRHDRIEDHEALDGMAESQRSAQTALWLANGSVERLLVQVIDAWCR